MIATVSRSNFLAVPQMHHAAPLLAARPSAGGNATGNRPNCQRLVGIAPSTLHGCPLARVT